MRTVEELQQAHDLLAAVRLGEAPIGFDDWAQLSQDRLTIALDTLCWVLEHDHNDAFANNLAGVARRVADAGYGPVPIEPRATASSRSRRLRRKP